MRAFSHRRFTNDARSVDSICAGILDWTGVALFCGAKDWREDHPTQWITINFGTVKIKGDASVLGKLASTMVDFDPRFEIMPGTKTRGVEVAANAYETVPGAPIAE